MNPWSIWTSFKLLLDALVQNTFILPCHSMRHIVAYHHVLIEFFLSCRCLSPLDRRDTDDVIDDTDEELYYLQKCQASKTPLLILIQSHSLAPALFYCIRTTMVHLLLAAVAEPFILCMTCHCHSKQMEPTSMSRSCLSPDVPTHSCLFVMPATAQS